MEIKKGTRFVYYGELVEITDVTRELVYCRTLTRWNNDEILEDTGVREIVPCKDLEIYMANQEIKYAKAYYEAIEIEKQRETAQVEAEAKRREHERFNGFTDSMSPKQKALAIKLLDKFIAFSSGIKTWAQYAEESGKARAVCKAQRFTSRKTGKLSNKITYCIYDDKGTFIEVPKTIYEYCKFMGGTEK